MQADQRRRIAESAGLDPNRTRATPAPGGDIASSFVLRDDARRVFVKCMPADRYDVLDAERDGLERIAAADALATPAVLASGCDEVAWLALEHLELNRPDAAGYAELGARLADLHRTCAARFGLERDNYIGATPQPNPQTDDWSEFFFEHRIGWQLELLADRGMGLDRSSARPLRKAWNRRFPDYEPDPSLLHGDLWIGNAAVLPDGRAAVFDPAVHHGDRECDLAMAALFGGFDPDFYDAYDEAWPRQDGWRDRLGFYQLYHVLNHANLFGGGYADASRRRIEALISG